MLLRNVLLGLPGSFAAFFIYLEYRVSYEVLFLISLCFSFTSSSVLSKLLGYEDGE
jgi:hypothetical protein